MDEHPPGEQGDAPDYLGVLEELEDSDCGCDYCGRPEGACERDCPDRADEAGDFNPEELAVLATAFARGDFGSALERPQHNVTDQS